MASFEENAGPRREALRREGREAAARALTLDPLNSEALAAQTPVMNSTDFTSQETVLKRALQARPLDCGCEHWQYSVMLQNVGRYADAAAEASQAVDMLAFDRESQFSLARSLNALGKREEAKQHFEAMIELDLDRAVTKNFIAITEATETGDYAAGIAALESSRLPLPTAQRAALSAAFRALASDNGPMKSDAARTLVGLPHDQQNFVVVRALAALGAPREALDLFIRGATRDTIGRRSFGTRACVPY